MATEIYNYHNSYPAFTSNGYTVYVTVDLSIQADRASVQNGDYLTFKFKVGGSSNLSSGETLQPSADITVRPINKNGASGGSSFSMSDYYNSVNGQEYKYRWYKSSGCVGFDVDVSFANQGSGFTMPDDTEFEIEGINFVFPEPKCAWTMPNIIAGQSAFISWSITDPDGGTISVKSLYRYYKPAGSSSYTSARLLSSAQAAGGCSDAIPSSYAGGTVYYLIEYSGQYGDYSSQSSTKTVIVNSAPSKPGVPVYPSAIRGGSEVTISWTESTDADDNLEGYVLECSTDGGAAWKSVYQGKELSASHSVLFGTESVVYRVKAYDSYGLESAYAVGSAVNVTNNNAPVAPSSITVPLNVFGGASVTITWSTSVDPDGDSVTYKLERGHDGLFNWTEVYAGEKTSYTDTVETGWEDVTYRVRAVDSGDAVSSYTTSPSRVIINNTPPIITCSYSDGTNLGIKSKGFSIEYSVSDADSDSIIVTEKLDGSVKRTFNASQGANNSFQVTGEYFMKVLNGSHEMVIEASDSKATTVHKLIFTKSVTSAAITLKEPMNAEEKISICVITVTANIPNDAEYKVEVTNNANDSSPVWEDCTAEAKEGKNYVFRNETAENGFAFNFRVTAAEGISCIGGYITSVQGGFQ